MPLNTGIDVLVIGEALIDVVESESLSTEHVGGSPANVALGLGRQGLRVALLSQLGEDRRGAAIADHLNRSHVLVLPQSYVLEKTSTAVARIASDGHADYEFDIAWRNAFRSLPIDAPLVHIGSVASFLEPGASEIRRLLQHHPPKTLTYDPNIRPALMPPHKAAVAVFEETAAMANLVKMSDEDAAWLYPNKSADDVVDNVLALGAQLAAITLGSEGAIVASHATRVTIPALKVRAVDTIGAGDTFMTSLISSMSTANLDLTDPAALHRIGEDAARAAAITVSRAGADLPWAADVAPRP
ncbi:carbohydrate kinase family protein [Microbacterium lacticum]|uniref:carbohydrate kinase family protein n=1 Tax=uncultured Microbacterium sp. TaxID=191216 RepID=UPI0026097F7D|nr:carbohydrate kinase [uncultured Microbacterium sp.]